MLIGFVLNPPCELLPNSGVLPKLLKRDTLGRSFYRLAVSPVYLVPFFAYEGFAVYCLFF